MYFRAPARHAVVAVFAALLTIACGSTSHLQARSLAPDALGASATVPASLTRPLPGATPVSLPLTFEPNVGQADSAAKFIARGRGYQLELQHDAAVVRFAGARSGAALRMSLVGSNPRSRPVAQDELAQKTNYDMGSDRGRWHNGVTNYAKVVYGDVYPGVDLVYYGHEGQLEYDFVVQPGADASRVRLAFQGADEVRVDAQTGELVVRSKAGAEFRHGRPRVYQQIGGARLPVAAAYRLLGSDQVGFTLSAHDRAHALVIDPTLLFINPMAGTGADWSSAIAADSAGNSYVAGVTSSYPGSQLDEPKNCGLNATPLYACPNAAFLLKIAPTGSTLFLTFFGGKGFTSAMAIAVASSGVYVAGSTNSTDLGHQATVSSGPLSLYGTRFVSPVTNAFVARFNGGSAHGTMIWSTYWGGAAGSGSNVANAIAIDPTTQAIYVGGQTAASDFPAWSFAGTAWQTHFGGGSSDGFVTKIDPSGLLYEGYSTFIGGTGNDDVRGIAVDSGGNAYVTGQTCSPNFPITNSALSHGSTQQGHCTAYFVKLLTDGNAVTLSVLLGGTTNDAGNGIAIDGSGDAYIVGETLSPDFPITANAAQLTRPCAAAPNGLCKMAFVTKLANAGGLVYSTFLGGTRPAGQGTFQRAYKVAAASSGQVYVVGSTEATQSFPGTGTLSPTPSVGFLTSLNPAGGPVAWTYTYATEITGLALGPGSGPGSLGLLATGIWITGYEFRHPVPANPPWSSTDLFAERFNDMPPTSSVPIGHF